MTLAIAAEKVDADGTDAGRRACQRSVDGATPHHLLTLLGEPAVDGAPLGSPTSSVARIAVYLALHRPTTRTRLAAALWPDVPEDRAQGSLRTGLWRLQRAHPGLVQAGSTIVRLRPGVRVDYHEVVQVAQLLLRPATQPLDSCDGFLRLAVDAELLPGWDQEWIVHEQERFRQLRLHALESLSVRLRQQGVFGMALDAALAALRCDPLRESAHRCAIEVHLAEGNLNEARRQYLACLHMLRTELALRPSPATLELGRRSGVISTGAAPPHAADVPNRRELASITAGRQETPPRDNGRVARGRGRQPATALARPGAPPIRLARSA
jgi:DNA-binding SARP family transcriptional activator